MKTKLGVCSDIILKRQAEVHHENQSHQSL